MVRATIDYDAARTPIGMSPPKTWAQLKDMGPYIKIHFPHAHESRAANKQLISSIRSELRAALDLRSPNNNPNDELPKDERDLTVLLLRTMHIFQPPDTPTTMQRVTSTMLSFASRAKARMFQGQH